MEQVLADNYSSKEMYLLDWISTDDIRIFDASFINKIVNTLGQFESIFDSMDNIHMQERMMGTLECIFTDLTNLIDIHESMSD